MWFFFQGVALLKSPGFCCLCLASERVFYSLPTSYSLTFERLHAPHLLMKIKCLSSFFDLVRYREERWGFLSTLLKVTSGPCCSKQTPSSQGSCLFSLDLLFWAVMGQTLGLVKEFSQLITSFVIVRRADGSGFMAPCAEGQGQCEKTVHSLCGAHPHAAHLPNVSTSHPKIEISTFFGMHPRLMSSSRSRSLPSPLHIHNYNLVSWGSVILMALFSERGPRPPLVPL